MRKLFALLLLWAGTSFDQSPFDGTWMINTDAEELPQKPAVYLLAKGRFRCSGCIGNMEIKADGHDQKIAELLSPLESELPKKGGGRGIIVN